MNLSFYYERERESLYFIFLEKKKGTEMQLLRNIEILRNDICNPVPRVRQTTIFSVNVTYTCESEKRNVCYSPDTRRTWSNNRDNRNWPGRSSCREHAARWLQRSWALSPPSAMESLLCPFLSREIYDLFNYGNELSHPSPRFIYFLPLAWRILDEDRNRGDPRE